MLNLHRYNLKFLFASLMLSLSVLGFSASATAGGGGGGGMSTRSTRTPIPVDPYVDLYSGPIAGLLAVQVLKDATKATIATWGGPPGKLGVAIESVAEAILTAAALKALGFEEEAHLTLAKAGLTSTVGAVTIGSKLPYSSYASLLLSVKALSEELSR